MANQGESHSTLPTILLLLATVGGLILANSPFADLYFEGLSTQLFLSFGQLTILNKSVVLLINDGLMAVFFLFIGLELKREIAVGELSQWKAAILPIFAAVGGMVMPALIYWVLNPTGAAASGWGIPMATDIAFALGVLTVLGSRVPSSLKILLAAVAIVDDLGAILVIALFYTQQLHLEYALGAVVAFAVGLAMNRLGVQKISLYLLVGIPMWYFTLKSGIHATIAGVALGALIPLAAKGKDRGKLITDILDGNRSPLDSPAVFLEKSLYQWIGLIVVPLFAFANAGVSLGAAEFGMVGLGVALGLFIGKPLGISGFVYFAQKSGLVQLPKGMSSVHILGLGCLAGIGFTMSLFISGLAFSAAEMQAQAKLAILVASVSSACLGAVLLIGGKRIK